METLEHTNEKPYRNAILDNTNLGYMKRCHRFKHCQELLTSGTHLKVYGGYNLHPCKNKRWWVGEGGMTRRGGGEGRGVERGKKGFRVGVRQEWDLFNWVVADP